jgi:hypothetical protein
MPGQIPKHMIRHVIRYHVLWNANFLSDEVTRCCKQLCSNYLNFSYFINLILPVSNMGPWGSVQKKLRNRQEIWWSVKPQLLWESPFEDSLLLHLVIIKNLWIAYQCLILKTDSFTQRGLTCASNQPQRLFVLCRLEWLLAKSFLRSFSAYVLKTFQHYTFTSNWFTTMIRRPNPSGDASQPLLFQVPRNHPIKFSYLYHPLTSTRSPEGHVCTLRYCDHRKALTQEGEMFT